MERPLKSLKSLYVFLISHCLMPAMLLPVRKWPIDYAEVTGVNETFNMPFAGSAAKHPLSFR